MPSGEHTRDTAQPSAHKTVKGRISFILPVVIEDGVPLPFFKSSSIDYSQSIHIVDAELIRSKSNDRAMLEMSSMDRAILIAAITSPEDPERREWRSPTCVWDF